MPDDIVRPSADSEVEFVSAGVPTQNVSTVETPQTVATDNTTAAEPEATAMEVAPITSVPGATIEEESHRLSLLPSATLRFDNQPLDIAVAIIADSAGMSYATNGVLEGKVTGSLVGNPYRLLKNLSLAYGFEMEYHQGLWTFASRKPISQERHTVTRTYAISHNMLEHLRVREDMGQQGTRTSTGGTSEGASSGLASGNLLAGRIVFETDYHRLINDLERLLAGAQQNAKEEYKPSVFLNEDGNSLLAVATQEEHELIEAYLQNFDKPQRAIALEVKLVRTKRNPSSLVGVDWNGGMSIDLSGTFDQGKVTLDRLVGGLGGSPTGVLITNSAARLTLDAIKNDSMTKRISYIEKMTLDNREVVLSNVVEEPVIGDREEVESQSGLRVLLSIEKETIGTVINILPRIMRDNTVKMRLRLEDSNIVRFKQFFEDNSGGEYPVISKQTYEGPVVIKDGYSLAITGFETTEEIQSKSRVPVLGGLPLVGKAFSREKSQEERSYLVIFITPRILPDFTNGLDYINRGHHLGRSEPLGPISGTQFLRFDDLEHYVSGIQRQHDEMMQMADLKGVTGEIIDQAAFMYGELEALTIQARSFYERGIEKQKAAVMLEFCEAATTNAWRILQQDRPPLAATPTDLVQLPTENDRSVYQASKKTFQSRKDSSKGFFDRFRGRKKSH